MSSTRDLSSFETARLRAEAIGPDHFAALDRLHRDPRVMATLGGLRTTDSSRRFLDNECAHWQRHGFGLWMFAGRGDGAFVGRAGLRHVHIGGSDEVELAYAVAADHWGRGYATEMGTALLDIAFRDLGLGDVVCFTMTGNAASRRVMDKLGFQYERELVHADLPHVLCRLTADR